MNLKDLQEIKDELENNFDLTKEQYIALCELAEELELELASEKNEKI